MFLGDFHSGTKVSYLKHLPTPKGRLWHPLQRVSEDLGLDISLSPVHKKDPYLALLEDITSMCTCGSNPIRTAGP